MRRLILAAASLLAIAVVDPLAAQRTVALRCVPQRPENLAARPSPYDSLKITVAGQQAILCYGRPSAKGRKMLGGAGVKFGELWRTGANEPTILHITFPAMIAGMHVEPGSYSIYTVPRENEWEIILNRSITQWGVEREYTDAIKAQEIGRGRVRSETTSNHVEMMSFRTEPAAHAGRT